MHAATKPGSVWRLRGATPPLSIPWEDSLNRRRTLNAVRSHTGMQTERLRVPNRAIRGGCLKEGNPEEIKSCPPCWQALSPSSHLRTRGHLRHFWTILIPSIGMYTSNATTQLPSYLCRQLTSSQSHFLSRTFRPGIPLQTSIFF